MYPGKCREPPFLPQPQAVSDLLARHLSRWHRGDRDTPDEVLAGKHAVPMSGKYSKADLLPGDKAVGRITPDVAAPTPEPEPEAISVRESDHTR